MAAAKFADECNECIEYRIYQLIKNHQEAAATMASETTTEPETQYKEAPFAEEVKTTIPAKVHVIH